MNFLKLNEQFTENINTELKMNGLLRANKLSLNAMKKLMIFHKPPPEKVECPLLQIGTDTKRVEEFNYLGIQINKHPT